MEKEWGEFEPDLTRTQIWAGRSNKRRIGALAGDQIGRSRTTSLSLSRGREGKKGKEVARVGEGFHEERK
jgi:hypothetical protein